LERGTQPRPSRGELGGALRRLVGHHEPGHDHYFTDTLGHGRTVSPKKRAQRPARRTPAPRKDARSGSPRPRSSEPAAPFFTPTSSAFRRSLERRSAPLLVLLTQLPRVVMMFAPLALLLLGFFLPLAIGLVFLAIFLLFTGWLAYLSWPRTDAKARLMRVAIFVLIIGLAVLRIARA
jgi:hypothetical protein